MFIGFGFCFLENAYLGRDNVFGDDHYGYTKNNK